MEPLSNLVIAIVAEVFFVALVIIVVWLVITRRQLRKQEALRAHLDDELSILRQRLQEIRQQLHAANEQIKQLQGAPQSQSAQLLHIYQQRITNLEKFKELYFELEERLAEADSVRENSNSKDELEHYKQRAQELEVTEMRLQRELDKYRRRVKELEIGSLPPQEIEDLRNRLKKRESELRRLREECETIGLQYEELATKSLAMVGEGGDLTDDQKVQLEELKQKLEENAAALARKQAECELLENCYLELEESAELTKTTEQMWLLDAECDPLQEQRHTLGIQVENAVGLEAAEEMTKLRQELADKEAALDAIRNEYREVKEQFIEVAQEEGELRESNLVLKRECEQLQRELSEIKATRLELTSQQEELDKLRSEYSKMEARYVALVQKSL